jgi:hypothetical protein
MFNGYNPQVTRVFSLNFDGQSSKIGDFELNLNEGMIAKATNLPLKGECWSKTKRVKYIPYFEILISSK